MIIGICIIIGIGIWFVYNTNKKTKNIVVPNNSIEVLDELPKQKLINEQLIDTPTIEVPKINAEVPSLNNITDGMVYNQVDLTPIISHVPLSLPTRRNEALFSKLNNYFG